MFFFFWGGELKALFILNTNMAMNIGFQTCFQQFDSFDPVLKWVRFAKTCKALGYTMYVAVWAIPYFSTKWLKWGLGRLVRGNCTPSF